MNSDDKIQAFLRSGGKIYEAKPGESGRAEFISGAKRARENSVANKKVGRKKKSSRWHEQGRDL